MKLNGEPLHAATLADWRAWLERHHADEDEVWLAIYKKHTGNQTVTPEAATEEALCFGWIDSAGRRVDDERFALRYSPRRKGSRWSAPNRERVGRLIAEGRMTDAGMARIEEAKQGGTWDPEA